MKASVVDLRYQMRDVLKALERNEDVSILYHGKVKGVLRAVARPSSIRVREHPFFGMKKAAGSVREEMDALRGGRYRDL